ncbi:MmcQ/YjbR family DNA-binding protein [Myroides sp. LJL119]
MELSFLLDYCQNKPGVTLESPFDKNTLVLKVGGKIFMLLNLLQWENQIKQVSLKCDPDRAQKLRDQYIGIYGAYHMNKRHWNTVDLSTGQITSKLIVELIDHSYELVYKNLTKKVKDVITNEK